MVKNTATLATVLALGGLAQGGNVQGAQTAMPENTQAVEVQANVTGQDENIQKQQQQPNCYYNYMEFDSNGECGENRRECFQVAGARYSLYPLKEKASMDGFLDGGKGGVVINQYFISDENAFAMTSGGRDLKQAMAQFQAKADGKQIQTLDDVKNCLNGGFILEYFLIEIFHFYLNMLKKQSVYKSVSFRGPQFGPHKTATFHKK